MALEPFASHGCAFEQIADLADLPADLRASLKQICQVRTVARGQVVAHPGEVSPIVGFVSDGILRMQKSLPDGRQHVVGLLVPGDVFGRVFDGAMQFSIEAATDCKMFVFPRPAFEALLTASPALDRLMLLHFLGEIDRTRDWMVILSNPKVRGRLAGFLLMLCTRFRSIDGMLGTMNGMLTISIPIARADLAHLLGARPESISRAFHALADDGVIDIIRPDLVALRDIEDLADEAGEPELGEMVLTEEPPIHPTRPARRI